jgi:cyclase
VIPALLLKGKGLVKTRKFRDPKYVGDPINAIRILNEKEVDELIFLDIDATPAGKAPDFEMLESIAGECFMPLCYGGGVASLEHIERILKIGVEKVAMNTALVTKPDVVRAATRLHGSSTIVGAVDFKRSLTGKPVVWTCCNRVNTGIPLLDHVRRAEDLGVGEILLSSIERDGTLEGYDIDAIHDVASVVSVPVTACGGAGSLAHFREAIQVGHASAVAAGSFFVFVGKHRAVLITYPSQEQLTEQVFQ